MGRKKLNLSVEEKIERQKSQIRKSNEKFKQIRRELRNVSPQKRLIKLLQKNVFSDDKYLEEVIKTLEGKLIVKDNTEIKEDEVKIEEVEVKK
jgi:hypothetical protein